MRSSAPAQDLLVRAEGTLPVFDHPAFVGTLRRQPPRRMPETIPMLRDAAARIGFPKGAP
jgi:hypothetical protein